MVQEVGRQGEEIGAQAGGYPQAPLTRQPGYGGRRGLRGLSHGGSVATRERCTTIATDERRQFLERLADALQTAALTAQRISVTSQQQQIDAGQCVGAVERAIAELQAARDREKGAAS